MPILQLAIVSPLRRLFDYLPPPDIEADTVRSLRAGCRLKVPFGSRQVCAVLVEIAEDTQLAPEKMRRASELIDKEPQISPTVVKLCMWAADYYKHALGEVLSAALPAALRRGKASAGKATRQWQLSLAGKGLPAGALAKAPRQAALLAELQVASGLTQEELTARGHSAASRRALQEKGLIEARIAAPRPATPHWSAGPTLNEEQQAALSEIGSRLDHFGCFLLHGITGSGKTEVYLRLIEQTLAAGKQALVLVPEIGLTPQLASRLGQRFDADIAALHSGMPEGAREAAWESARNGCAHIVIGTRSAIFASLARPGLIIVDEEHDASFKQHEGFRYSARDLAVKRAQLENIPVVLGSATPSLESLHNAESGRYRPVRLTRRIGSSYLPGLEILDIRRSVLHGGLSDTLLNAIEKELGSGNQVLLFLNRRGYAPTLQCHDCGFVASCRHCDARLTLHRSARELRCHHCDWRLPLPDACPDCHSRQLNAHGVGTERTEELLTRRFAGTPVYRVDRDSMQRENAMAELNDRVEAGHPCILLGTQMLTKGHHFPGITLVGLLDTDASLFSADFRGPERMGQLVTQVAGRAGRANKPGRVILQTHYPDHPLLRILLENGYGQFASQLLEERKQAGLPPFGQLMLVRADAAGLQQAEAFLAAVREQANPQESDLQCIGPVPAPMQRRSGRYRAQLLYLSRSRAALRRASERIVSIAEEMPAGKRLRWSVDIDPLETL